jgi:hypothetical protein
MPQEKTIATLTADERLALVALIERVLLSERPADEEEANALDAFVEKFGEADYAALVAQADSEFEDDDRFEAFLRTITDPDARELILGTVVELALVEGILTGEAEWIGWTSEAWNVPVSVAGEDVQTT